MTGNSRSHEINQKMSQTNDLFRSLEGSEKKSFIQKSPGWIV